MVEGPWHLTTKRGLHKEEKHKLSAAKQSAVLYSKNAAQFYLYVIYLNLYKKIQLQNFKLTLPLSNCTAANLPHTDSSILHIAPSLKTCVYSLVLSRVMCNRWYFDNDCQTKNDAESWHQQIPPGIMSEIPISCKSKCNTIYINNNFIMFSK